MVHLDTNIYFSWFNISFLLIFIFDDEEACNYDHTTCHMIWGYRPRLWKKGLEGW